MGGQISKEDLYWWFGLAPSLPWTWAKTYSDSAPHWYVVLGTTPGLEREDFVRAARVIRTFGKPGQFWANTYIYLHDAHTGMKWWTMEDPVEETTLINMAEASLVYRPQIVSPSS